MAEEFVKQLADGEELVLQRSPSMDDLEDPHERIIEIRRFAYDRQDHGSDHERR